MRGNSEVRRVRLKDGVLRHQTERADLTPVASDHSDIHDAADPDRDVVAEPHARRSDDASLDGMAGDVRVGANDDVITELEQVVITERKSIDVHPAAEARTAEA